MPVGRVVGVYDMFAFSTVNTELDNSVAEHTVWLWFEILKLGNGFTVTLTVFVPVQLFASVAVKV